MTTKWSTSDIGPRQVARTFHAVRFANDNGLPLNLMVTIDFTSLGVTDEQAGAFFQDTWSRFTRWYAYQRSKGRAFGSFDAYAVHEHPPGGPRHVHWVMRVPAGARAEVERVIRQRVEKLTGSACLGRAINFKNVPCAGGVAKYTLKGARPHFASLFYIRPSDQGTIVGRRVVVSRSIGFTARYRAGWVRQRR